MNSLDDWALGLMVGLSILGVLKMYELFLDLYMALKIERAQKRKTKLVERLRRSPGA